MPWDPLASTSEYTDSRSSPSPSCALSKAPDGTVTFLRLDGAPDGETTLASVPPVASVPKAAISSASIRRALDSIQIRNKDIHEGLKAGLPNLRDDFVFPRHSGGLEMLLGSVARAFPDIERPCRRRARVLERIDVERGCFGRGHVSDLRIVAAWAGIDRGAWPLGRTHGQKNTLAQLLAMIGQGLLRRSSLFDTRRSPLGDKFGASVLDLAKPAADVDFVAEACCECRSVVRKPGRFQVPDCRCRQLTDCRTFEGTAAIKTENIKDNPGFDHRLPMINQDLPVRGTALLEGTPLALESRLQHIPRPRKPRMLRCGLDEGTPGLFLGTLTRRRPCRLLPPPPPPSR